MNNLDEVRQALQEALDYLNKLADPELPSVVIDSEQDWGELKDLGILGKLDSEAMLAIVALYNKNKQDKVKKKEQADLDRYHQLPKFEVTAALQYIQRYPNIQAYVLRKKYSHEKSVLFAIQHYRDYGRNEGKQWGPAAKPVELEAPRGNHKDVATAPSGFIWKPIADSRGGVPVLLTPAGWGRETVELRTLDGTVVSRNIEYRGLTNNDRETYFFLELKARDLPSPLILDIGTQGTYIIENPRQRYD